MRCSAVRCDCRSTTLGLEQPASGMLSLVASSRKGKPWIHLVICRVNGTPSAEYSESVTPQIVEVCV